MHDSTTVPACTSQQDFGTPETPENIMRCCANLTFPSYVRPRVVEMTSGAR